MSHHHGPSCSEAGGSRGAAPPVPEEKGLTDGSPAAAVVGVVGSSSRYFTEGKDTLTLHRP